MLQSVQVVGLSWGPLGEVKRSAKVIPNPGPVMEDVRQADPEAQVHSPAPSMDFVHNGLMLIVGINLNQVATTLLALSS